MTHPLLNRLPVERAVAEIDQGAAAVEQAAGRPLPQIRFFRFPGFADSAPLLDHLASRQVAVFGADFWASDWNPMTPEAQFALVARRLEEARRGIVLFHDTKRQTAEMIPAFLRALKQGGYRVVHLVPAQ